MFTRNANVPVAIRPGARGIIASVLVLAFSLRLLFVWMGAVEYPIRGDINQYVLYAWNLSHHGVFSADRPSPSAPAPNSYRTPGYPALLATTMLAAGHADLPLRAGPSGLQALGYQTDTWMRIALGLQILLGTATVGLVFLVGRCWLPRPAAVAAAAITALWPHLISFSGVLLSETLFGFALLLAVWLLLRAEGRGARGMGGAGLAWGVAYLVNPIVALFPLMAAALLIRRSKPLATALLAGFLVLPASWSIRNAISTAGTGSLQRIEENFVQGSWPQYLTAMDSRFNDAISMRIVAAVDAETRDFKADPVEGMIRVAARMALDPAFFLRWYSLQKPFLLWDWDIRIGAGDIYFLAVEHSPFEKIPLLRFVKATFKTFNPLIFVLAMLAALVIPVRHLFGRRRQEFAPLALSLLLLYLTAVHVVLQAEPRYSVPYRPAEILLAMTAVTWVCGAIGAAVARRREALGSPAPVRNG